MWFQIIAFAIAIWVTVSPDVLSSTGAARAVPHVIGPLAATVALIGVYQATRPVRWVNLLLGGGLALIAVTLGFDTASLVSNLAAGCAIAALAFGPGMNEKALGGGWRILWREPS